MMKNILIGVFLFSLVCYTVCEEEKKSEDTLLDDNAQKIIIEMGLDTKETIDRATFKILFEKILFKEWETGSDDQSVFKNLIEKIAKSTPDVFPTSDIPKYLDMSKIIEGIQELTKEKYGDLDMDEYLKDVEDL